MQPRLRWAPHNPAYCDGNRAMEKDDVDVHPIRSGVSTAYLIVSDDQAMLVPRLHLSLDI